MKEWSYLTQMTSHNRYSVLKKCFKLKHQPLSLLEILLFLKKCCWRLKEEGIAVLQSHVPTSRLSGEMSWYLDSCLAERTSVHGVLMDIYGMGVLIQGRFWYW